MMIQGVLGPIDTAELGQTLMHEHITCADWSMRMNFGARFFEFDQVAEIAAGQLGKAKALGVRTVVDGTPVNLGRDIRLIREVARRTGLNFIASTGYQILVVTRASAQGLDRKYLDSFRSLGGSPVQTLRHILIPAALPDAMTALKVASGTAVAVLFMAESFATRKGLGFLIMDAWGRGDQLEMFTGILAMSLLGVALYELCNALEKKCCRWRSFQMKRKR